MSKPIEGCPQPEAEIRERAYTPEQLERHAKHCDAVEEHDAARMLRTFAATLRQQTTNSPGISSKLVDDGAVSDGWDGVAYANMAGELESWKRRARQAEHFIEHEVQGQTFMGDPLLRAPAETEAKVYACPRCATSMQVDPSAKPRPPAEQGGRVDGWQPIETAPKDGTPIFIPYCGRPVPAAWDAGDAMWRWKFLSRGMENAYEEGAVKLWHPMLFPASPAPDKEG